jgi:hypothetical protein
MNQPSCEDLRLGKTIEGFSLHSPLGQGPFYRIYGADRGPEEWKIFAWDKLPTPPTEALNGFEQQASRLASLKHPSIIPVVGPFTLPDGAIAWAVSQPNAKSGSAFAADGAKTSQAALGLAAISEALSAACGVGALHPGLSLDSLWFSKAAPFGLVGGFFSWRRFYPALSQWLPPEEPNPHTAPQEANTEASLVYTLANIGQTFGLRLPAEALSETPAQRPSLPALAAFFSQQRPGFWGRLFGR